MSIVGMLKLLKSDSVGGEEEQSVKKVLRSEIKSALKSGDVNLLPSGVSFGTDKFTRLLEFAGFDDIEIERLTDLGGADAEVIKAYNRNSVILLQGPPGTGKSVEAKETHEKANPGEPFIEINCATLSPNLAASELFGHVKGSFTGADTTTEGAFVKAGNGTLFLDEIEDLSLSIQGQLNTVLETMEVRKVGSSDPKPVNCTIIAASNRDLEEMADNNEFRLDLLTRLTNGYVKNLKPSSERPEDVVSIAGEIIDNLSDENGVEMSIDESLLSRLQNIKFTGNFRDLKSILKKAFYKALDIGDTMITIDHIKDDPRVKKENVLEIIRDKLNFDDDTTNYIADVVSSMSSTENEIIDALKNLTYNNVLMNRITSVYKDMGGSKDIRRWLQKGGDSYVRQYLKNRTNLSDEAIIKAFKGMMKDAAIYDSDVAEGMDAIIESVNDIRSLLPKDEEVVEIDDRNILSSLTGDRMIKDNEIFGVVDLI